MELAILASGSDDASPDFSLAFGCAVEKRSVSCVRVRSQVSAKQVPPTCQEDSQQPHWKRCHSPAKTLDFRGLGGWKTDRLGDPSCQFK